MQQQQANQFKHGLQVATFPRPPGTTTYHAPRGRQGGVKVVPAPVGHSTCRCQEFRSLLPFIRKNVHGSRIQGDNFTSPMVNVKRQRRKSVQQQEGGLHLFCTPTETKESLEREWMLLECGQSFAVTHFLILRPGGMRYRGDSQPVHGQHRSAQAGNSRDVSNRIIL